MFKIIHNLLPSPLKHLLFEWLARHFESTNIRVIDGCLASGFIGPKQYNHLKSLDLTRKYLAPVLTRELDIGCLKRFFVWVVESLLTKGHTERLRR